VCKLSQESRTLEVPRCPREQLASIEAERDGLRANGFDAGQRFFKGQRKYVNDAGVAAAGPAAV
jgi:hypothetical protein